MKKGTNDDIRKLCVQNSELSDEDKEKLSEDKVFGVVEKYSAVKGILGSDMPQQPLSQQQPPLTAWANPMAFQQAQLGSPWASPMAFEQAQLGGYPHRTWGNSCKHCGGNHKSNACRVFAFKRRSR